jgi:hypothetical protein
VIEGLAPNTVSQHRAVVSFEGKKACGKDVKFKAQRR